MFQVYNIVVIVFKGYTSLIEYQLYSLRYTRPCSLLSLQFINSSWRLLNSYPHLPHLFSCSVMSDSLRPHGLQHARLPCPSPSPTGNH